MSTTSRRPSTTGLVIALLHGALGCGHAPEPTRSSVSVRALPQTPETGPAPAPFEGLATWYGERHHGRLTASGERFDMNALTAAHKTLPMNTRVRVVNLANGREVVVRINDRGPYGRGRIIDLSRAAAEAIRMIDRGVVRVRIEPLR